MNYNANIHTYGQIPLCWLLEIALRSKIALDKAISYAIIRFSKTIKYLLEDVARQVLYDYYHDKISGKIEHYLGKNGFEKDYDYKGFEGKEFNPSDLEKLTNLLKDEPNNDCIEWYQIHAAKSLLNVSLSNVEYTLEQYKEIDNYQSKHERLYGKQPMPSIGLSLMFSFRDNPENIELFLAYVSIKSLIGQRHFTATNKDAIVMRMIGSKNKEALIDACKNKALKSIYSRYINRYWFDKLMNELLHKNFISSKVGYKRKLYISTTLNHSEIAIQIAEFIKAKDLKAKEKQAKDLIKQHLYNGTII